MIALLLSIALLNGGVRIETEGPRVLIWKDTFCIASNDPHEMTKATAWASQIDAHHAGSVAMLGLGTGNLLRMIDDGRRHVDVYEIEPSIIRWYQATYPFTGRVRFVFGDYRKTLRGRYDVVVEDTGLDGTKPMLQAHLRPGGLLLHWKDLAD